MAILHLGDIVFVERISEVADIGEDDGALLNASGGALATASKLLGVRNEALRVALCTRTIEAFIHSMWPHGGTKER